MTAVLTSGLITAPDHLDHGTTGQSFGAQVPDGSVAYGSSIRRPVALVQSGGAVNRALRKARLPIDVCSSSWYPALILFDRRR